MVEKDAVFTYLCNQCIWNTLPCVLITGCGYPPLSVRAVLKSLADQLNLPVLGLFDYNPHGVQILLTYKYGSVRMGMESHAYTVDLKWLGLHHHDIVEEGRVKVDPTVLQDWTTADERVFKAVKARVDLMMEPQYSREMTLMQQERVKAEIEAVNTRNGSAGNSSIGHLDSVENIIIHKIVCKKYF